MTSLSMSTMTSLRPRNFPTMSVTPDWSIRSAVAQATWENAEVHEMVLMFNWVKRVASSSGSTPYPMRHPVMA